MNRPLVTHELASAEFEAAVRWYDECRRGLGAEFFDAVNHVMVAITEAPEAGTPFADERSTRRMLVRRFPYQVIYHLTPTTITIAAIAHLKRRPGYWKGRA